MLSAAERIERLFRLYTPEDCLLGRNGYPPEWDRIARCPNDTDGDGGCGRRGCPVCGGDGAQPAVGIKDLVRAAAGHRCIRCGHPYRKGEGEWSDCDSLCRHLGPIRSRYGDDPWTEVTDLSIPADAELASASAVQARYRILTVHHLDGVKGNCRWWNLVALCQRCHLTIQGKVQMARVWPWEHTDWFKPYVAGYYAHVYLGEDLSRVQVEGRLEELLALERVA